MRSSLLLLSLTGSLMVSQGLAHAAEPPSLHFCESDGMKPACPVAWKKVFVGLIQKSHQTHKNDHKKLQGAYQSWAKAHMAGKVKFSNYNLNGSTNTWKSEIKTLPAAAATTKFSKMMDDVIYEVPASELGNFFEPAIVGGRSAIKIGHASDCLGYFVLTGTGLTARIQEVIHTCSG